MEDHLYDAQWGGDDAHLLVVGFFDASPLVSSPRVDQVEVFRVSLATGRAVERVTRNALDETRFHASPDGTRLIVGRPTTTGQEAVLLTAGGEDERVIATGFDFIPRWASDSRHVSYLRPDGIWLLDIDDAEAPTKLSEGSGQTPAHSWPDLYLER